MLRLFSVAAGLIVLHPSWLHAVAEPLQLAQLPARVDVRAFGGDLSFCYGTGSICAISNDLFDECEALMEDYTNLDPWYKCMCSNGYVSVHDACYYCQLAYHLDVSWNGPMLTEGCQSVSATIAPIPSSVLSRESRYNATYTGVISGAATATGSSTATTTSDSDDSATSTTKTTSRTTPASTFFGGTTAVETFNGGGTPETTKATTTSRSISSQTTTTASGVATGAASIKNPGTLLTFWLVMMGIYATCA